MMRRVLIFACAMALLAMPLAAGDLTGSWQFTWYTPDGPLEATMQFTQDGRKLTAKFDEDTLSGSIYEEHFRLKGEYYAPTAGYTAVLEFHGVEEDGKLTGEGVWDTHDLSFEAVRAD